MTKHDPDAGFEPAFAAPSKRLRFSFSRVRPGREISLRQRHPLQAALRASRAVPQAGAPHWLGALCIGSAERLWLLQFLHARFDAPARSSDPARHHRSRREQHRRQGSGRAELDRRARYSRNISPVRRPEAGLAASMRPRIARLAKICGELGWHLDFLTPGWLVSELMPTLRELPIEFSVAHMGLFPAKDGPTAAGFSGISQAGRRRFETLLGQAHRHLSLLAPHQISPT